MGLTGRNDSSYRRWPTGLLLADKLHLHFLSSIRCTSDLYVKIITRAVLFFSEKPPAIYAYIFTCFHGNRYKLVCLSYYKNIYCYNTVHHYIHANIFFLEKHFFEMFLFNALAFYQLRIHFSQQRNGSPRTIRLQRGTGFETSCQSADRRQL